MVMLSTGIDRMHALLPTEVIGVIVLMVGICLLPSGLREMLAIPKGLDSVTRLQVITVSFLSFGIMVAVTVANSRIQRLGLLIGVAAGTLASLAAGMVQASSANLDCASSTDH